MFLSPLFSTFDPPPFPRLHPTSCLYQPPTSPVLNATAHVFLRSLTSVWWLKASCASSLSTVASSSDSCKASVLVPSVGFVPATDKRRPRGGRARVEGEAKQGNEKGTPGLTSQGETEASAEKTQQFETRTDSHASPQKNAKESLRGASDRSSLRQTQTVAKPSESANRDAKSSTRHYHLIPACLLQFPLDITATVLSLKQAYGRRRHRSRARFGVRSRPRRGRHLVNLVGSPSTQSILDIPEHSRDTSSAGETT